MIVSSEVTEDKVELFDKKYFVGATKSNFKDYRKRKFEALALDLITTMFDIHGHINLLIRDFGCGTGALVHQLHSHGITDIKGTDISQWSIAHGKNNYNPELLEYYNRNMLTEPHIDFILFLDVLEHMPLYEIENIFKILEQSKPKRIIIRLPVSQKEGEDYILPVSRNDKTHIQVHSKRWWDFLFTQHGFTCESIIRKNNIYESAGVLARVYRRKTL